ncbi:MAG: YigZ family protein [Firmicutes bacterium]|nr:YigZ family protein [Bacillota bacterium]
MRQGYPPQGKSQRQSRGQSYTTVLGAATAEIVVRKSRFIATIAHVESEAEAMRFIGRVKEDHRDATHNVYAFRIGHAGEIERQSDDGEPGGTAGKPVLEALRRERDGLTNIAAVVTRYFGGILLGANGLVRAYSQAAKAGLDRAQVVTYVPACVVLLLVDYQTSGKLESFLRSGGYPVIGASYGKGVALEVAISRDDLHNLAGRVADISAGRGTVSVTRETFWPMAPDGRLCSIPGRSLLRPQDDPG